MSIQCGRCFSAARLIQATESDLLYHCGDCGKLTVEHEIDLSHEMNLRARISRTNAIINAYLYKIDLFGYKHDPSGPNGRCH